jgi:hypothetical protein
MSDERDLLSRIDENVQDIQRRLGNIEAATGDHASRITALETTQANAKWVIGGIGVFLCGIFVTLLAHILSGK